MGKGREDIDIYRGPLYHQSGAGLGSFFRSAARYIRPLISSGMNALKDQSLNSAGTVLSQLGKKDLKTILNEESEKAVRNLSEKAINKIRRSRGDSSNDQMGSGMIPYGLSPLQIQQLMRSGVNRKLIKRRKATPKGQQGKGRRRKTTLFKSKNKTGRGSKKKSVKSKSQSGAGRRRKSVKKSHRKKKISQLLQKPRGIRSIDIFE